MAVDLYAGPLCRYYARDFKTKVQQRFPGAVRLEVGADGSREVRPKNPSRFRDQTIAWQRGVARIFHERGAQKVRWPDLPKGEYSCDQFLCWRQLVVVAAYASLGELPIPDEMIKDERTDAAMTFVRETESAFDYPTICLCTFWVPFAFEGPVGLVPLPDERAAFIGSVQKLRDECHRLLRQHAGIENPDGETLTSASKDESRTPLMREAIWGAVKLLEACAFALEHTQPMLVDY